MVLWGLQSSLPIIWIIALSTQFSSEVSQAKCSMRLFSVSRDRGFSTDDVMGVNKHPIDPMALNHSKIRMNLGLFKDKFTDSIIPLGEVVDDGLA